MDSVYDRYGGQPFWDEILDRFYVVNLNHQVLRSYFEGKDVERVKLMNRGLLSAALRPSSEHFPVSIKRVHKFMNINEHQFNTFVANLLLILTEKGVSQEDAGEIMNVIESFRSDVVTVS